MSEAPCPASFSQVLVGLQGSADDLHVALPLLTSLEAGSSTGLGQRALLPLDGASEEAAHLQTGWKWCPCGLQKRSSSGWSLSSHLLGAYDGAEAQDCSPGKWELCGCLGS